jgi:hypothetical protein
MKSFFIANRIIQGKNIGLQKVSSDFFDDFDQRSIEIVDDESLENSTGHFTTESSSTANPKYNYCLNYIKAQKYASKNKTVEKSGSNKQHVQTDFLNKHIEPIQVEQSPHFAKQGLTPPNIILSTIQNRLYKANQAIQTKKYDFLNNMR